MSSIVMIATALSLMLAGVLRVQDVVPSSYRRTRLYPDIERHATGSLHRIIGHASLATTMKLCGTRRSP